MGVVALVGCGKKTEPTTTAAPTTTATPTTTVEVKSYNFVIYESDSDNYNLSDNKVVTTYTINYTTKTYVPETLIKNEGKYYFAENGTDYFTIKSGMIDKVYFKDYSECAGNKEIDASWSYCAVNGQMAPKGIEETTLDGLVTYGLVINGWKDMSF